MRFLVPWILASTSPRREKLLREIVPNFKICNPDVQEYRSAHAGEAPLTVCQKNAQLKAAQVSKQFPEYMVLGADTIVVLDNQVLNKPRDLQEACQMLEKLSGRTHSVFTAVCCRYKVFSYQFYDESRVSFSQLTEDQIDTYVKAVHPLDKAGAYAIQEPITQSIAHYEGSLNNIIGLPTEKLLAILQNEPAWQAFVAA